MVFFTTPKSPLARISKGALMRSRYVRTIVCAYKILCPSLNQKLREAVSMTDYNFYETCRAVNDKGGIAWAKDREMCTCKELLMTRKLWED